MKCCLSKIIENHNDGLHITRTRLYVGFDQGGFLTWFKSCNKKNNFKYNISVGTDSIWISCLILESLKNFNIP